MGLRLLRTVGFEFRINGGNVLALSVSEKLKNSIFKISKFLLALNITN